MSSGEKFTVLCKARDYPGIKVEIEQLASRARETRQGDPQPAEFHWFLAIVLGPFYVLSFGLGMFLFAVFLTLITSGLAWPFISGLSFALWQRDREFEDSSKPPG